MALIIEQMIIQTKLVDDENTFTDEKILELINSLKKENRELKKDLANLRKLIEDIYEK
jgi:hypothetical protein